MSDVILKLSQDDAVRLLSLIQSKIDDIQEHSDREGFFLCRSSDAFPLDEQISTLDALHYKILHQCKFLQQEIKKDILNESSALNRV